MAHTTGRSVVPSSAAMAAPRPHPPNRKPPPVEMPGVTGQHPAVRVVRRLEAEPGPGVHRPATLRDRSARTDPSGETSPAMSDTPWLGDACSLVDAFRAGERSPVEELEAALAAIEASDLNAFSFVDRRRRRRARPQSADVSLPFGGVPDRHQGARPRRRAGRAPRRRSSSRTASPTYDQHDARRGCSAPAAPTRSG